jgi:phage terminase small subunit
MGRKGSKPGVCNTNLQKLDMKKRKILRLVAKGWQQWRAYQEIMGCAKSTAMVQGSHLCCQPLAKEYLEELNRKAEEKLSMERAEALEVLVDIIREEIDDETITQYDSDGLVESTTTKSSKTKAIKQLADMLGWNEAQKHVVEQKVINVIRD